MNSKGAHGYRKFFKTHAEQFMNHSNVELLLGHSTDALQASYYKPTESDVLNDYLKAVDILTIDYDKNTLKKQVAELTEKSKEDAYIIKGKLTEKEKEMEETKSELAELKAKQEEASRKQQLDIDQIKAQLEKNAEDQVSTLLQALSKLQKQEANSGTAVTEAPKDFVLKKLGTLTNGTIGKDPETGLVSEPVESSSKSCIICEAIERKRQQKKKMDVVEQ